MLRNQTDIPPTTKSSNDFVRIYHPQQNASNCHVTPTDGYTTHNKMPVMPMKICCSLRGLVLQTGTSVAPLIMQ